MPETLFEKIWNEHVVRELGGGWDLLHVDRHLIHDLSGEVAFGVLQARGLAVQNPELAFATPDHAVSSAPGRTAHTFPLGGVLHDRMQEGARAAGIKVFDLGEVGQGIVHVMGPEMGLVLPGSTVICGDSHTCTNGGLGALAFGVGTSECVHALATQTLRMRRPRTMRITVDGELGPGVTPKDLILYLIALLGSDGAVEHTIEYAGAAIRSLGVEGRLTVCNLSVEMGARSGLIAPDDRTFAYLKDRPFAPRGADFDRTVEAWRSLRSDDDARFDREVRVDAAEIEPTITWGTSPDHAIAVNGTLPDPNDAEDPADEASRRAALEYMGLQAGQRLTGTQVDWVFIGSCANSRLSDLQAAAGMIRGRHVAPGVTAWVVPGSEAVKRAAEAEGLDDAFRSAGFQWREPGCSMCVAANGERVPPGARAVSTNNRNFVGRQGPGARTHLASPAMAAAAALAGSIVDARTF